MQSNEQEEPKRLETVEFFKDAYVWPETDHNQEIKAKRKQIEDQLMQEREEMKKRRYQQEQDKQQQHLEEQKQAERERIQKQEEERKRKEEAEQRSKLEGRFELMLSNLQENNTPQEYTVAGLNLGSVRLRLLAKCVEKNISLLGLHVCRMQISDDDAIILQQMLMINGKLQKLELEGNKLGPSGVKTLVKALETNCILRVLDLESNSITGLTRQEIVNQETMRQDNAGVEAIAQMLKVNKTLLTLNLGNTGISEEGGNYLVDAMEQNTTLISLEITDNGLSVLQIRKIQEYLNRNKKAYDDERLREFKERKMMNEEDAANKNLLDIEEKKKEEVEIQQKNKQNRFEEKQTKYSQMVMIYHVM